ncbi:MAG: MFS transporter, partial [Deltaproteobacteria bacterium]|nr:MFS transporter [Deltaproteobacteria bacterium]
MALPSLIPPCEAAAAQAAPETLGCAAHAKRWVLWATVLASSTVFLQATVINVALPAIQTSLGVAVATMQWLASVYTLGLAALTLVGGALGDHYGRRRLLTIGLTLFSLATAAAGLAPSAAWLIAARAAQGVGAALVAPNSLAHLSASFPRAERGRALGLWSAASALVGGAAPLLGGWLVDVGSWPPVFWLGLPPALLALALTVARVPESRAPLGGAPLDLPGAALASLALSALTAGLITAATPAAAALPAGLLAAGAALSVAFLAVEARRPHPMLPLGLFRSRVFSAATLLTVLIYAAISATFFLLPFALVQAYGYSATATGALFLPFALVVGLLSHWAGGLVDRRGARAPLVAGPLLAAAGLAWLARPPGTLEVWAAFVPAMTLIGLGMAVTAAPLTSVVMGAVPPAQAGIAAGVNNSAARLAGLLGVAAAGLVALAVFGGAVRQRVATLDIAPALRAEVLAARRAL